MLYIRIYKNINKIYSTLYLTQLFNSYNIITIKFKEYIQLFLKFTILLKINTIKNSTSSLRN